MQGTCASPGAPQDYTLREFCMGRYLRPITNLAKITRSVFQKKSPAGFLKCREASPHFRTSPFQCNQKTPLVATRGTLRPPWVTPATKKGQPSLGKMHIHHSYIHSYIWPWVWCGEMRDRNLLNKFLKNNK